MVTRRGVSALSMRTLAAQAETSTTAVYSLFGGRSELLQALYVQAFSGFGAAQEAVPVTDDPSADLIGLGRAYRCWALDHPHFYAIMFGGALVGIEPDERTLEHCRTTMDPLLSAVGRGREPGSWGTTAPRRSAWRSGPPSTARCRWNSPPASCRCPDLRPTSTTRPFSPRSCGVGAPDRSTVDARAARRGCYSWCRSRTSPGIGAVAQLVARFVRIEEVRGSIPLSSTTGLAVHCWRLRAIRGQPRGRGGPGVPERYSRRILAGADRTGPWPSPLGLRVPGPAGASRRTTTPDLDDPPPLITRRGSPALPLLAVAFDP